MKIKLDGKYIIKWKYWPEDNGTLANVEILKAWKGDELLPPAEYWQIDERKLMQKVKELLQDDSEVGDGFNVYNPNNGKFETN